MKFLFRAAALSIATAWLILAQQYVSDEVSKPCLKSFSEMRVQSLVFCAISCRIKKCIALRFHDGVCKMYNIGESDNDLKRRGIFRRLPLANVAVGKPVVATRSFTTNVAELANDCHLETLYHTDTGLTYSWWNVDLENVVAIHTVRIYPNVWYSLHIPRFHNIEVSAGMVPAVGDASTYTVIGYFTGPFDNSSCCSVDFSLGYPVSARYVHVRRATAPIDIGEEYLILNEVEVLTQEL